MALFKRLNNAAFLLAALVVVAAFVTAHGATAGDREGARELQRLGFITVNPHTRQQVKVYAPDEEVNGVSVECRKLWMRKTIVVQMNAQQTLCPRGAFGAIIVNHSQNGPFVDSQGNNCGSLIETNSGLRETGNDPTAHSEIGAIRRLSARFPGQGFNKAFWSPLSMYTNGESCPMDAAAEAWAGMKEQIYSVSIDALFALNFTQIAIDSEDLYAKSGNIPFATETIIRDVEFNFHAQYFAWQNIPTQRCPTGCHRNAAGTCVDDVPFVPIAFP